MAPDVRPPAAARPSSQGMESDDDGGRCLRQNIARWPRASATAPRESSATFATPQKQQRGGLPSPGQHKSLEPKWQRRVVVVMLTMAGADYLPVIEPQP